MIPNYVKYEYIMITFQDFLKSKFSSTARQPQIPGITGARAVTTAAYAGSADWRPAVRLVCESSSY